MVWKLALVHMMIHMGYHKVVKKATNMDYSTVNAYENMFGLLLKAAACIMHSEAY